VPKRVEIQSKITLPSLSLLRIWPVVGLILLFFITPLMGVAQSETIELKGLVLDSEREPLAGVQVVVRGTNQGTVTNHEGRFTLQALRTPEMKLVFSMMGYQDRTVDISDTNGEVMVTLEVQALQISDVVVSASRVQESIMQSPVTIEKMTALQIRESPAMNMYDAVASLKGVDVMASSLTFKSLNTRGFNSPANSRFVIRIDGIDMQAPGLNMPPGMLNGSADLDIENVELVPGAASALYGPNAFNGIMNIQTKSPFQYPGLSVSLRTGATHVAAPRAVEPANRPFYDLAFRFAKPLGRRFAFKVNLAYLAGHDWHANDTRDVADYSGTTNLNRYAPGPGNPGYDGLNLYGDEVAAVVDSSYFPAIFFGLNSLIPDSSKHLVIPRTRIARTPYAEQDLLDYDTYSLRGDVSLHYRLGTSTEVSWTSRLSRGTSVLQADNRISLNNFIYHNHKIELTGKRFFLRAYGTFEDAGDSYDSRFAAMNVNRAWKSDTNWFAQYNFAYFGILEALNTALGLGIEGLPARFDDAQARAFADGNNQALGQLMDQRIRQTLGPLVDAVFPDLPGTIALFNGQARFQPGTEDFNNALTRVKRDPNWNTGARFIDRTSFYHTEGQYDFTDHIQFVDLIAGASYRNYQLNSQGIIFADTAWPITVQEYGLYAQATRRVWDDRLRFTASGRFDKTQRFDPRFTPRLATVLALGKHKQHNLRLSYQTGFRMPELRHQFVSFSVGPYTVIGGFDDFFRMHGLVYEGTSGEGTVRNNAYTLASVQAFRRSQNPDDLRRVELKPIRPEQVRTFELGYKAFLTQFLMVDASVYASRYRDFIGSLDFIGPRREKVGTNDVAVTHSEILTDSVAYFRRYLNAEQDVNTWGASVGMLLALGPKYSLMANYTYSHIESQEAGGDYGLRTEFNTPAHKANATFAGRNLRLMGAPRFGFAVNYRWIDSYLFQFGFGNGVVPAYSLVDAQVSYKMPKLRSTFKLGGTNVLNNRHVEMFGGPSVGSMVYIQITYDEFLN
jgi:outer membrane receptor protein involved in Fe transport